jgi:long-chain acyl-CoA synthetase
VKELVFSRCLIPTANRVAGVIGYSEAKSGEQVTFGDHISTVARLATAMSSQLGVAPEDRIAVLSANGLPYVDVWHAALLGAAVINPLNSRFSADELAYVLKDSESKVCFVSPEFAEVIWSIRDRTSLEHVVLLGEGDVPSDVRYADLLAAGEERFPAEPEEEQPAVLIYTGGTTGKPKGVILDQRAEVLNQYHFAMRVPWRPDEPFLIQTPMFHGASMLGVAGAPMFGVPSVILPAFEPVASMSATEAYNIGITVLVPTMIGMILNHPDFEPEKLSSLKRIVYGASPMPRALLTRLLDALPETEIIQGYGMTEGCTILTTLSDAEHRRGERLNSAGLPLPGVELAAVGPDGEVVPPGAVGEIFARGGNFMLGYLNKPEETAQALRDGWYHSGDVGYLDAEGFLFLVDRAKDMIISGGENVYSVEVEDAIASHPAVLQVAVIGIPHETWGEAVHAVVVVKPGCEVSEQEIIGHARATIAGYKVPRSVELRTDPLPLSAAMKVLKRELRAAHWGALDRAIN